MSIPALDERNKLNTGGAFQKDDADKCPKLLGWDFPGGPVVKTSPSNEGGAGSIPGGGARIPHASWPESQEHKIRAIL